MKKIPRCTYRLQFHPGFTFDDAAAAADYLAALGISHVYASPYLQAAPGSTHGYDIVDYTTVNRELGGKQGHERFCRALSDHGLSQVIDVVPNHMSINPATHNRWWWDVLKNGSNSAYNAFFDIDWRPPESKLAGKVLLPVLEDHYGRVLEDGKIRTALLNNEPVVTCSGMAFPLSPSSVAARINRMKQETKGNASPPNTRGFIEAINVDPEALDELLKEQHYRLAYWRTASEDLNYRRFFSINELAGIRVEHADVFFETHNLVIDWLRRGIADGVRIDHPDGMADPEAYFKRLAAAAPDAWMVVEKILHEGEKLPGSWPVDGTTGYEFLNLAAGLFIDPAGEDLLTRFYSEFTGGRMDFEELARRCKHRVMDEILGAEIRRITELMVRICEAHRRFRDYTRREIHSALTEVLACLPVYRTYVRSDGPVREVDRRIITEATARAGAAQPDVDPRLFGFIRDILCRRCKGDAPREMVIRFQQASGPVTAKGIEDTAFYRYNRLSGMNEVGGNPSVFGILPEAFHGAMKERSQNCPAAMLATSTHDTKRSEDVRARLALLSEIPGKWRTAVLGWSAQNETFRKNGLPDANMEYLLYQSLLGAWPIDAERTAVFMEKAAREAKEYTTWENPDATYENALLSFVSAVLADESFTSSMADFVAPLVMAGRINALSQTLIKLSAPGVPDIYQGCELWDLSLVDPDNRRPVDYALRRRLLTELDAMTPEEVMEKADDGLPKLFLIRRALDLRKKRPEIFSPDAGYRPLPLRGKRKQHGVAFLRGDRAAVIVPRLVMGLMGEMPGASWKSIPTGFEDTRIELPAGRWHNLFTGDRTDGGEVLLSQLLSRFPVALLVKEPSDMLHS